VGAGGVIERFARDETRLTVTDVVALYAADSANQSLLARAIEADLNRFSPGSSDRHRNLARSSGGILLRATLIAAVPGMLLVALMFYRFVNAILAK
jgi:hypothetical protein